MQRRDVGGRSSGSATTAPPPGSACIAPIGAIANPAEVASRARAPLPPRAPVRTAENYSPAAAAAEAAAAKRELYVARVESPPPSSVPSPAISPPPSIPPPASPAPVPAPCNPSRQGRRVNPGPSNEPRRTKREAVEATQTPPRGTEHGAQAAASDPVEVPVVSAASFLEEELIAAEAAALAAAACYEEQVARSLPASSDLTSKRGLRNGSPITKPVSAAPPREASSGPGKRLPSSPRSPAPSKPKKPRVSRFQPAKDVQQNVGQPQLPTPPARAAGPVKVSNPGTGTSARTVSQVRTQIPIAVAAHPSSQVQSPGDDSRATKVGAPAIPASGIEAAKVQKRDPRRVAPSSKPLAPTERAPAVQVGARAESRRLAPKIGSEGSAPEPARRPPVAQNAPVAPQVTPPSALRPSHSDGARKGRAGNNEHLPSGSQSEHASSGAPKRRTRSEARVNVAGPTGEKAAPSSTAPSRGRHTQSKKKAKEVVIIDLTETDPEDNVHPAATSASATVRQNRKPSTASSRTPSSISRGNHVPTAGDHPEYMSPPPPTSNNVVVGAAATLRIPPSQCMPIAPRPILPRPVHSPMHVEQNGSRNRHSAESAKEIRKKKARMDREEGKTMLAAKKVDRNKGQKDSSTQGHADVEALRRAELMTEVRGLGLEAIETRIREERAFELPGVEAQANRAKRAADTERARRREHRGELRDQAEVGRRNRAFREMTQRPLSVGEGARRLVEQRASEESRRREGQRLQSENRDTRHPLHCAPSGPETNPQRVGQTQVSEAQIQKLLSGTPSDEHHARELAEIEARRAERLREQGKVLRERERQEDSHRAEVGTSNGTHRTTREKANVRLGRCSVGEARRLEHLRVQMETRRAEQLREEQRAAQGKAEAAAQEAHRAEHFREQLGERKKTKAAAQEARRAKQLREEQEAEQKRIEVAKYVEHRRLLDERMQNRRKEVGSRESRLREEERVEREDRHRKRRQVAEAAAKERERQQKEQEARRAENKRRQAAEEHAAAIEKERQQKEQEARRAESTRAFREKRERLLLQEQQEREDRYRKKQQIERERAAKAEKERQQKEQEERRAKHLHAERQLRESEILQAERDRQRAEQRRADGNTAQRKETLADVVERRRRTQQDRERAWRQETRFRLQAEAAADKERKRSEERARKEKEREARLRSGADSRVQEDVGNRHSRREEQLDTDDREYARRELTRARLREVERRELRERELREKVEREKEDLQKRRVQEARAQIEAEEARRRRIEEEARRKQQRRYEEIERRKAVGSETQYQSSRQAKEGNTRFTGQYAQSHRRADGRRMEEKGTTERGGGDDRWSSARHQADIAKESGEVRERQVPTKDRLSVADDRQLSADRLAEMARVARDIANEAKRRDMSKRAAVEQRRNSRVKEEERMRREEYDVAMAAVRRLEPGGAPGNEARRYEKSESIWPNSSDSSPGRMEDDISEVMSEDKSLSRRKKRILVTKDFNDTLFHEEMKRLGGDDPETSCRYRCIHCDVLSRSWSAFVFHMKSKKHKRALPQNTRKFCDLCSVQVPWNGMEMHTKGKRHLSHLRQLEEKRSKEASPTKELEDPMSEGEIFDF